MKKINIAYWSVTGIFAAFMLFSAIPDMLIVPEAVTMITGLGYPTYFIPFIGVAKLLGVIAILVPGFNRIKEWAYAGLFFDLIGYLFSDRERRLFTSTYVYGAAANFSVCFLLPLA